ncbi:MAG: hypothetical protein ACPGVU_11230 [Limisphaerales bacterium]
MKNLLFAIALLISLSAANAAEREENSPRPSGPSRDEFKDVVVYNIFNPDRGPRPPKPKVEKREKTPPPPRTDRLTLTGIIMGRAGNYGFFDGSARDFQAVVKQGDKLAEFDVAKVTTEYVDLTQGTNKFQLKIRGELTKKGDDPWKSGSTSSGSYAGSTGSRSSTTSSTTSSTSASGGDDEARKKRMAEILAKMRKRKEAEK